MTKLTNTIYLIFFSLITGHLFAQEIENLAIGDWESHLPYHYFSYLTQSETTLYCATPWSLMLLDKEENSVQYLSKINGLSNTGMSVIKYNAPNDILIVTYSNSIFDLLTPDGNFTVEDIKTDGNFFDRSINDIYFHKEDFAYFSTGFGISKFDLINRRFVFTLDLGIPVESITIFEGTIYAATEEGIYIAPDDDDLNLQDFSNWRLLDVDDGFPGAYGSSQIVSFQNQLFFNLDDDLYRLENGVPELVYENNENLSVQYLTAEGRGLILGLYCGTSCNGKALYFDENLQANPIGSPCLNRPRYALEDSSGRIWFVDNWSGLRETNNYANPCQSTLFNSPVTQNNSDIAVRGDRLYIASGGVDAIGNSIERSDGVFIKNGPDWSVINRWNTPILEQTQANVDFYKIALHPENEKVYFGTYYGGLVEHDGETTTVYNDQNSSLQGAVGDEARERVSGLAFDSNNHLWMSNHSAMRPISVFKNDGTWQNFSVPSNTGLRHLIVDGNNTKWMAIDGSGQGILVFDDGGTLEDISDDRYKIISESNSELPSNEVLSLTADLDGDIWIGTTNGIGVVQCGTGIIEGICGVNKPIVEENSIDDENAYLLEGETVTAIAVDGANRKWCGTTNGVFVISEDGKEQVAFFNQENSDLFDNTIIAIEINGENGEVFIGTNKGVLSYRSDAITGTPQNRIDAYAFPNPVRPEYEGPIAIKGLAENADVKITDINGQLIYETQALGGQAIWNGRDYNGRRAATGVYLVFSTSRGLGTPDAIVTKILVMN